MPTVLQLPVAALAMLLLAGCAKGAADPIDTEGSATVPMTGTDANGATMGEAEPCGNGIIDVGEDCEGINLAGKSCQSLGFTDGMLLCDAETCTLDTQMCFNMAPTPMDPGGGGGGG
ncbi:MAG: hypothetical protein OXT09_33265 [Myxococcales bacterium]|nr:hypothetical protein [Myxococcales bacterium]